jgi:NAD(P)H dehydrogenase (quinone)
MEPVNAAVIYYSATVHALAQAAAEGAEKAGANTRLRNVAELAPPEAISAKLARAQHLQNIDIDQATLGDLAWADVVLLGTPTRFGNPANQLRAFIDTAGPLWHRGGLAGALLALGNVFYHGGDIVVPPCYTDPVQFQSGNPCGTSRVADDGPPSDVALEAARCQAQRAVDAAATLKTGRTTSSELIP